MKNANKNEITKVVELTQDTAQATLNTSVEVVKLAEDSYHFLIDVLSSDSCHAQVYHGIGTLLVGYQSPYAQAAAMKILGEEIRFFSFENLKQSKNTKEALKIRREIAEAILAR